MSEHLQLSQETRGSRERFGTKKGIRCVPYPSVWHFPSLEVKGCPVDERLGWLSRAMLGECASAAEALSCVCSPGRKSKRACKEPAKSHGGVCSQLVWMQEGGNQRC